MCAVAHCKEVGAGIKDVSAGGTVAVVVGGIVACDILHIDLDRHHNGFTGLEGRGLVKAQQLDRRLFHTAHGVRSLTINLDRSLCGNVTGVGHLHVEGRVDAGCARLIIVIDAELRLPLKLTLKGGVAQTIAKAVCHLVVVVPLGGRSVCTHREKQRCPRHSQHQHIESHSSGSRHRFPPPR